MNQRVKVSSKSSKNARGLKIGCIEEVAYQQGFIDREQLLKIAEPLHKSGYGKYLSNLVK